MSELRKRLWHSIAIVPFTALISFVFQRALAQWGVFDPLAADIGLWLKLNLGASIAIPGVLWGIVLLFSLSLYAGALLFIWLRSRPAAAAPISENISTAEPPVPAELNHDVWLQDAVWYAAYGKWFGENEAVNNTASDLERISNICQTMRRLASEGRYVIWGKTDPVRLCKNTGRILVR